MSETWCEARRNETEWRRHSSYAREQQSPSFLEKIPFLLRDNTTEKPDSCRCNRCNFHFCNPSKPKKRKLRMPLFDIAYQASKMFQTEIRTTPRGRRRTTTAVPECKSNTISKSMSDFVLLMSLISINYYHVVWLNLILTEFQMILTEFQLLNSLFFLENFICFINFEYMK